MAHIVALSSWVAHGHVGLSAAVPVLQALGHRVTQLPTVQLSNHAGWSHVAGGPVAVSALEDMADALARNGWLHDADAVLTGYMPSAAHVDFAARLIDRLVEASPRPRIVVDPVLGDLPKGLYIAPEAAGAIRDALLPRADVLTPNLFELSWLAGRPVETPEAACDAARQLGPAAVFVTSPPLDAAQTGVLAVLRDGSTLYRTDHLGGETTVPHGVGDVFAALVAAGLPAGAALGHLRALIGESLGAPHLRIAEAGAVWRAAKPIAADAAAPLTGPSETR
jgi:pyridoxine kinase